MVEPGGIQNMDELKLLVLYVLGMCEDPIPRDVLNDILLNDGLVDFFDSTTALDEVVKSHLVQVEKQNGEDCYMVTPAGRETASLLEKNLSYTVREKTAQATHAVLRQRHLNSQVRAEYMRQSDGSYLVDLILMEGDHEMFSLRLTAPNLEQVGTICRNFKQNPTEIFGDIIRVLTTPRDSSRH